MDYASILSLLISLTQYAMHIIVHVSFNISNKSVNMEKTGVFILFLTIYKVPT